MKNIIGIEDNIRVLAKGLMGAISVLFDTTSKLQERFDLLTATNLSMSKTLHCVPWSLRACAFQSGLEERLEIKRCDIIPQELHQY